MTSSEAAADDTGSAADDLFTFDRNRTEFVDLVADDGQNDTDRDEPVVARAAATLDLDTSPLSAYAALADRSEYNFLLESAEKVASSDPDGAFTAASDADRHARYSFVGYDPEAVISVYPTRTEVDRLGPAGDLVVDAYRGDAATDGDVLDRLRRGLPSLEQRGFPPSDRRTLSGGLVGFIAHEAVYDLVLEEVGRQRPATEVPDAQFALTTRTLVFDDAEGTVELVSRQLSGPMTTPETATTTSSRKPAMSPKRWPTLTNPSQPAFGGRAKPPAPKPTTRRPSAPPNSTFSTVTSIRASSRVAAS